ncbi:GFA family protein [Bradyrhizobium sp. ORS 111]|uniref:GFA family protein n=1 Tax=Bradyrhizobium sp. ORS 111 TaxID=1685958 RepID=UPI003890B5C0
MMGFADGAIRITPGAREFTSKADSGNDIVRAFCPTCGSGIYSLTAGMPHFIFLRASALDDTSLYTPQLAVWAARAPAWDVVPSHLPAFAEAPLGN